MNKLCRPVRVEVFGRAYRVGAGEHCDLMRGRSKLRPCRDAVEWIVFDGGWLLKLCDYHVRSAARDVRRFFAWQKRSTRPRS